MIEGDTIRFRPEDMPELPELLPLEEVHAERTETPEPEGWRPIGGEW